MQFFRKGLEEVITLPAPNVPDIDEVEEVKRIVAARTATDVKSVMDHDRVPFYAIQKVCDENGLKFHPQEFKDIIYQQTDIINHFKEYFNRARPVEVDPTLNTLPSETNKTRSYPSGHAIQGYLIGQVLANKDKSNAELYLSMGEQIAESRISAKAHYPSDKEYGKKVADVLFMGLKND